jgi:hypothetical protein
MEEPGSQVQMRGTGDGQKFGKSLHDGEQDHLIDWHQEQE